jgi:hypothetical protein
MTKQRVQSLVVSLVVIVLVMSALGYLFVPSAMLSIVGIEGNRQVEFLVRTLAAALLACPRVPGPHGAKTIRRPSARLDRARGLHVHQFARRYRASSCASSSAPSSCG